MTNHLMLDFETLGNTPDTAVVSLGAVLFNREGIFAERLWLFNLTGQLDGRRRFATADTITWWMGQGEKAKSVFEKAQREGVLLKDFATQFVEWVDPKRDVRVWGNGATFDVSIIESILLQQGVKAPWKFWNHRCYRTLKQCYGIEKTKFQGTKHDALDDSKHQATQLIQYWKDNNEKGLDK